RLRSTPPRAHVVASSALAATKWKRPAPPSVQVSMTASTPRHRARARLSCGARRRLEGFARASPLYIEGDGVDDAHAAFDGPSAPFDASAPTGRSRRLRIAPSGGRANGRRLFLNSSTGRNAWRLLDDNKEMGGTNRRAHGSGPGTGSSIRRPPAFLPDGKR